MVQILKKRITLYHKFNSSGNARIPQYWPNILFFRKYLIHSNIFFKKSDKFFKQNVYKHIYVRFV